MVGGVEATNVDCCWLLARCFIISASTLVEVDVDLALVDAGVDCQS